MNKITEERGARSVSISQPEVLLQTVQVLMKHPLFTNMSMNSVMILIKNAFAFIYLKKMQILYHEQDNLPLTYIPIYGELNVWSTKNGQFGRIKLGATTGEEALVDRNFTQRTESCYAEHETCLICINKYTWQELKQAKKADVNLQKDMLFLEEILRKNNSIKKRWRQGIISSKRSTILVTGHVS